MSADLYEILGVARDASPSEIKAAYRKMAKQYHPDLNPGDGDAEEMFKKVNAAHEILSDPEKRRAYDQFGSTDGNPFAGGGNPFGGGGGQGFGDLFDILNSVFGGGMGGGAQGFGGRGGRPGARRGSDMRRDVTISFQEAAEGVTKKITVPSFDECDACHGNGAEPGTEVKTCGTCGGIGVVRQQQGFFSLQRTCPTCDGEGTIIASPCKKCRGEGVLRSEEELEVDIPAGVDTGQQIRWTGKGGPGAKGGPPGDLYFQIILEDHTLFERDGMSLLCTVPISFTLAALGGKVDVPTLSGKLKMTIPEGTQTGKVFRLRGKGFPSLQGSQRGDQLVTVVVETPVNLNERQRQLLTEFAEESGDEVHPESKSFFKRLKDLFD